MRKYLALGGIIILSALAINYFLGGFKKVKPTYAVIDDLSIYGQAYEGRYTSDSLDNVIKFLQDQIAETDTSGSLVIVNYLQEDLEKLGVVKQFVGIIWADPPETNLGLDTLLVPTAQVIQFSVPINPLVMPSPEKLKKMAVDEATRMGRNMLGYSIEQYQNRQLVVSFPIE